MAIPSPSMFFDEKRLETFNDWPFKDDCNCTPQKMAAAGFYHCPHENTPDCARCFACHKELDGWEPTDDPMKEHKSHSPKCPYIKIKDPSKMTLRALMKLIQNSNKFVIKKQYEEKVEELREYALNAREQVQKLL